MTTPQQPAPVTALPGPSIEQLSDEDRELLAAVSSWAHDNDWNIHRDSGWRNPSGLIQVDWDDRGLFIGRRATTDHVWPKPVHYPTTSVREAVDILVAIRILPAEFASAYLAGINDFTELMKAFLPNLDLTAVQDEALPLSA